MLRTNTLKADLSGKVIFITGCTSGFGVRFAKVLSHAGAKVAITGRRVERLEALKAEIEEAGGTVFATGLDVTDEADLMRAFDETEQALGPIDIIINNAGVSVDTVAINYSAADYDYVMNTNLRAVFLATTEHARRLKARGAEGTAISISSIGSHTVLKGNSIYCMSKAAVSTMTECLAREYAKFGVNVVAIAPGYIETEINSDWYKSEKGNKQVMSFPRRRLGDIDDLDGVLLLLCSDEARIISGTTITVDDAQSKTGI